MKSGGVSKRTVIIMRPRQSMPHHLHWASIISAVIVVVLGIEPKFLA